MPSAIPTVLISVTTQAVEPQPSARVAATSMIVRTSASWPRRVIDYITDNVHVTAGGVLSHRMLRTAIEVLGPDRVMFGDDDPYRGTKGRFGGEGGAREFVETAPLGEEDRRKLGHLNAERLWGL
ncbi:amidohydrolase family protein [Pseudonocardia pini]|uniref:amidohydrolase family protein n=1 Tax=Pseudonocardia pini TaxID=2758030 RepID=UPI0015F03E13|nr:amidohydrolase family protein [Pseudonocardia pini]